MTFFKYILISLFIECLMWFVNFDFWKIITRFGTFRFGSDLQHLLGQCSKFSHFVLWTTSFWYKEILQTIFWHFFYCRLTLMAAGKISRQIRLLSSCSFNTLVCCFLVKISVIISAALFVFAIKMFYWNKWKVRNFSSIFCTFLF